MLLRLCTRLKQRCVIVCAVSTLQEVHTFEELDSALRDIEQTTGISSVEGRERLLNLRFIIPNAEFSGDPYSPEYASAQLALYLRLSGRTSYDPATAERSTFEKRLARRMPFPYESRSAAIVGEQLIAWGFLIRAMNLAPGASLVEFGAGWGNLTLQLAQMGHRVTVVDIEKRFLRLLRYRASRLRVKLALKHEEMTRFSSTERFDAALFFESFHHCAHHLRLLRNLYDLTTPDGLLAFASEPIDRFPHPWGFVRTDGLTLWSIRRFGWFELGFDLSYFLRTLLLFGWLPQRFVTDLTPVAHVIVARKSRGLYVPSEIALPPDEAETWFDPEPGHRFTTARSVMSCSTVRKPRAVEWCVSNNAPFEMTVHLTAGESERACPLPAHASQAILRVDVRDWNGRISLAGPVWRPADVYQSTDHRELGVAVHWIRLADD
jgi:2-polyprenyl-3-methyl-5-hydroxy-6-metoxy-1,4-benzoquinol methylase